MTPEENKNIKEIESHIKEIKTAQKDHNHADDVRFDEIKNLLKSQNEVMSKFIETEKTYHENMLPMLEWFKEFTLTKKLKLEWMTASSRFIGLVLVVIALFGAVYAGFKFLVIQSLMK